MTAPMKWDMATEALVFQYITTIKKLKAENAELCRLIKEVAIPALALYARTDKAPKVAIQWLQEAVK